MEVPESDLDSYVSFFDVQDEDDKVGPINSATCF